MTVASILAQKGSDIVTVNPDESLLAVAQLLDKNKIGAVVAVDGEPVAVDAAGRRVARGDQRYAWDPRGRLVSAGAEASSRNKTGRVTCFRCLIAASIAATSATNASTNTSVS